VAPTGHDGIFQIPLDDVEDYCKRHHPVTVLRHDKNVDTKGLQAMNIGVAKGSTFDRVVIFPTKPMLKYLEDRDETKLKAPERLYVAVTRARFSVAFVVPSRPKYRDTRRLSGCESLMTPRPYLQRGRWQVKVRKSKR